MHFQHSGLTPSNVLDDAIASHLLPSTTALGRSRPAEGVNGPILRRGQLTRPDGVQIEQHEV
jgi:hypothetical protein